MTSKKQKWLSWSQLTLFEQCPFLWYGRYVKKWTTFVKNIHLMVGSAAHYAIEEALKQYRDKGSKMTVPNMVGLYVEKLKEEGCTDVDQLQYWTYVGQNMLQAWRSRFLDAYDIEVLQLEGFVVKKGNRHTGSICGVVDAILNIDGETHIVDWKTSSRRYSQKDADTSGQLSTYHFLTNVPEDTKVAFGVLVKKGGQDFQFLSSIRTPEQLDEVFKRYVNLREKTQSYIQGAPPEKIIRAHCDRCDIYNLGKCEGRDDF